MYVDGYLLAVPKKNVKAYQALAKKAGKIWREYGCIEYRECVADDVKKGKVTGFPQAVKLKKGEVVVFSWAIYKSKAHRDRANKLLMKDKRILDMLKKGMPFDSSRMMWGGYKVLVDL